MGSEAQFAQAPPLGSQIRPWHCLPLLETREGRQVAAVGRVVADSLVAAAVGRVVVDMVVVGRAVVGMVAESTGVAETEADIAAAGRSPCPQSLFARSGSLA